MNITQAINELRKRHCLEFRGEKEQWKLYHNSTYAISSYGRVFNLEEDDFAKLIEIKKDGYMTLYFNIKWSSNGQIVRKFLCMAVGELYLGLKQKSKHSIHYIDLDHTNCFYKNLEFKGKQIRINYETYQKLLLQDKELDDYLNNIISIHKDNDSIYI